MEPAATRKAQVMNALKSNDNDSDLFLAIAKVFWVERKAEKVKKWLRNAVTVNKDNGDAWAHLLRYELDFGCSSVNSKADLDSVLVEFREADPRHGELWAREAKRPENWRRKPEDVLRKVALQIKLFEEI
jgi:pre-mRNA-processing factor 6